MKWQPLIIALFFVLSQAALFTGCVGLLRRRPLVLTGPGVAMVLVGGTVALLGACAGMILEFGRSSAALAGFVGVALLCMLLVRAVHAAESTCLVIGTTRRWVSRALRASLFRLSIPLRDQGFDDDIRLASGQDRIGVLQRLVRPVHLVRPGHFHQHAPRADLAREMDAYFAHNAVYTDTAAFGAIAVAGVILLVVDVYVWLLWIAG